MFTMGLQNATFRNVIWRNPPSGGMRPWPDPTGTPGNARRIDDLAIRSKGRLLNFGPPFRWAGTMRPVMSLLRSHRA